MVTMGSTAAARSHYKEGLQRATDDPMRVAYQWMLFERLHGSRSDVQVAADKIKKRTEQLWQQQKAADAKRQKKEDAAAMAAAKAKPKAKAAVKGAKAAATKASSRQTSAVATTGASAGAGSTKPTAATATPATWGVGSDSSSNKRKREAVSDAKPVEASTPTVDPALGKRQKVGDTASTTAGAATTTATTTATKPASAVGGQQPQPAEQVGSKQPLSREDELTCFVSNLPFKARESELMTLFARQGEVEDLSVVMNRRGRCKGYAYVRMANMEGVDAVLALHGSDLHGREIRVERYQPIEQRVATVAGQSGEDTGATAASVGGAEGDGTTDSVDQGRYDPCTVFVANIPAVTTEGDVLLWLKPLGVTVESVLLPRARNGVLKGYALVTLADPNGASQVLQMPAEQLQLLDTPVNVSRARKGALAMALHKKSQPVKRQGEQRKSKVALLLPRALARRAKTTTGSEGGAEDGASTNDAPADEDVDMEPEAAPAVEPVSDAAGTGSGSGGAMTNADFRRFLG